MSVRPASANGVLRQVLAVAVLLLPAGACAEWLLDASAGYTYDDNLSNGLADEDRKADSALLAGVRAGWHEQLGAGTGVTLALLAEQNGYLEYSGLSNFAAGVNLRLRHKFGLGYRAPWLSLSGQALYRNYHDDDRDGWQYDAGAVVGVPLSARFSLHGSVRYDAFEADQTQPTLRPGYATDAYDTSGWNLGAKLLYVVGPFDLVSAGYGYRDGSVTAVTQPDREILEYSDAVAVDTVFGTSPRRIAYRFDGETDTLSLAWSHAFSAHLALTVSYAYRQTRSVGDLDPYYANVFAVSLGYSR